MNKEATERDDIGYLRAKRVKVSAQPPQKVVVDGELIGDTPIEVECLPKSLTVFVPVMQEEQPMEKLEGLPNVKVELKNEG
ncbi:MAG: hypothetical protein HC820_07365 [Hydrococcus sp. RM1_1_31]|nr:hypothetical protein [Hydrococcus sp. RM1_1_31]